MTDSAALEADTWSGWDEFVEWARRFYAHADFDENERTYKLEISEKIRSARDAVRGNDDEWPTLLKRAFGPPNNLTYHITHVRFLDWTQDEPDAARQAMLDLWDAEIPIDDRVQAFTSSLPDPIATPGSRLEITSFLLLAEPFTYPMYKPTPIKTGIELADATPLPDGPDSAVYRGAREFLDEFIQEASDRGLDIQDCLDAQGLVWSITKAKPEHLEWDDEDIERFLRWRGDKPGVFWVNQGASYQQERDAGVVSAPFENAAGAVLSHHKVVSTLRKGDIILHHADGAIRAISEVTHKPGQRAVAWAPDEAERRVTKTKYYELDDPISVRDMNPDVRTPDNGPFDKYGGVKQIYMEPISPRLASFLRDEYRNRWPADSPWEPDHRQTWLFQANPDIWDLAEALETMEPGDEDDFLVNRFKSEIGPGDRVLLWASGKESGLYAIATISGDLFDPADAEYDVDNPDLGEMFIPWRLDRRLDERITRQQFLDNSTLKGMSIITAPQGTNFRVSEEQWREIERLLEGDEDGPTPAVPVSDVSFDAIANAIANRGLIITDRTLRRFHVSMRTRGFVVLSGVSGTGKTWLTKAYADAIGAEYLLVPVAPNWTTNEDLLGYLNPLDNQYYDTNFSRFLRDASTEYANAVAAGREPRPFILALDEMNLARVEYYFAKFLSAMEVRMRDGVADLELAANETVQLGENLKFVGTVNVDETTHPFADKVYDRAQLVELDAPRDAIEAHIKSDAFRDPLMDVYDAVADTKPFAYRVVDDIQTYVDEADGLGVSWRESVDEQILQKVLPKLAGADPALSFALTQLIAVAEEQEFDLTRQKAERMLEDYERDGFTSYF